MTKKTNVIVTREAKSYVRTLLISRHLTERAMSPSGQQEDVFSALVFLAFSIEAFCNHMGYKLIDDFSSFDHESAKDKLKIIAKKFDVDLGRPPFQAFYKLRKFRDDMAHSRSEVVEDQYSVNSPEKGFPKMDLKPPSTEWELFCTKKNLKMNYDSVVQGLCEIYEASGLSRESPFDREKWNLKMSQEIELAQK
ncbi:MAG: hypothetical protein ISR85_03165 [Kiritimatiellales bacterium]|nr:hypothetical protein [Kiritimatiellales bacterium]